MTPEEMLTTIAEIGNTFTHLRAAQLDNIGESILPFDVPVVLAGLKEQAATRQYFDLPLLLKACNQRKPKPAEPLRVTDHLTAQRKAEEAQAAEAITREAELIGRLTAAEVAALRDEVLEHVQPWMRQKLRGKDPRDSPILRGLIADRLLNGTAVPS